MLTISTFKRGISNGLNITWELAKVVVPVYFAVTFLKYSPVLPWLSSLMSPMMQIVGLPGEASMPLILGYFINIYAAIGAILPLGLDSKEITIISAMLLMAHSLPIETAVSKKTGIRVVSIVIIRLVLSLLVGILFAVLLHTGSYEKLF
ncbi:MAG: nucleoside recognition domain-containing protein [Syntrophomonadaceae bacterium]|nr:nucleoside recognition domain-containing protein [Syntrophomonadaceae bacterium]